jgi:hypothetical protein
MITGYRLHFRVPSTSLLPSSNHFPQKAWNGQLSSRPFIIMIVIVVVDWSWDSSLGIATGYGWMTRVRFSAWAREFFLFHSVQTGSEAHKTSYPMDIRDFFPGGKVVGA